MGQEPVPTASVSKNRGRQSQQSPPKHQPRLRQARLDMGTPAGQTDFNTHPQPRTFAPSKEDVLQNLQYFFGAPVSPEKLKDYSEHHAMTCAPEAKKRPNSNLVPFSRHRFGRAQTTSQTPTQDRM